MVDIHPSDIALNVINIVVLFVLLRLILWKPLHRFLSARAASVQETLDNAEKAQEEALALKETYQQNLDGLETEGRELLRASHIQAEEEVKEILAQAKTQAEGILAEARVKIESEKAIAVARARDDVAQLATDMAARILKREVTVSDNVSAADDFFDESR